MLPFSWLQEASSGLRPNSSLGNGLESTRPARSARSLDGLDWVAGAVPAPALRALIAGAYWALCAVGLVGNVLVLVLVPAAAPPLTAQLLPPHPGSH